jgi:dolichyl-phosphate beta-glucosyltransferase
MRRFTEFALPLVGWGLIIFALFRHFDLRQIVESIHQARFGPVILSFALMACAYALRAARCRIWEPSLSYWDSLRLVLIGLMAKNVLPARLARVLRADCAAAKTDYHRGRSTALAAIAGECIVDSMMVLVLGLVAVALIHVDGWLRWALLLVSLVFACVGAALVLSFRHHEWISSLTAAANRKFHGHVTVFGREKTNQLMAGLLPLGTLPRMLGALSTTAIIWGIGIGVCYCFGLAVWHSMTVQAAVLLLSVAQFASLLPLTLGGIGPIEVAGPLFLISSGVPPHFALAMVLLQHTSQYVFTTITGGILYLAGDFHRIPLRRSETAMPVHPESDSFSPVIEEVRFSLGRLGRSMELKPACRDEILLSIVIPAYNEQARLPRTLFETIHWCGARKLDFELIITDDGSRDDTLVLARLFEESDGRIRVLACPHMGKGAAVRMGILNAKGHFVLFMDADGATPLTEIPKLLAALESGYDVAIGSRVVPHAGEVEVSTKLHRRVIGRTFAFLVNLLAFAGIDDTQCGFKMFRRTAAAAIFSRQKLTGFAFDVEILFLARRLALSIVEIPVNWIAQPGSKVNLIADSMRMLWDISRLKWLHRNFNFRSLPTRTACHSPGTVKEGRLTRV